MEIQMDYNLRDTNCKKALKELGTKITIPEWLHKHETLFNSISISPAGYPSIADANINGEYFEWIARFHQLYNTLVSFITLED
jgi:hypothetical protein